MTTAKMVEIALGIFVMELPLIYALYSLVKTRRWKERMNRRKECMDFWYAMQDHDAFSKALEAYTAEIESGP